MPEPTLIVSAWSHRAEARYAYGPFGSEELALKFADQLEPNKWEAITLEWLNPPSLFGTGMEVSGG